MRVVSFQAGPVRTVTKGATTEETAIDKRPLGGAVRVTSLGVEGDAVADRRWHGGPDQALLCFSAGHYPHFEARLGRALSPGAFGENLTIEGLEEGEVRLGDVYRVGTVELQVTAPRTPCGTLARHLGDADLVAAIRVPHRAGWYARVLREGEAAAGDALALLRRGATEWSVRRAAGATAEPTDREAMRALLRVEGLGRRWRAELERRLAGEA